MHPQPITTCSFPHIGWVHELLGWRLWCWLYCLRPFPLCSLENEETFVFIFIVLTTESHSIGQIRWGCILEGRAPSVKFNCFWVEWSITVVQAEHCNHALHQANSISAYIHQSHSKKSVSLHNLTARTFTLLIIRANTTLPLYSVLKRGVEWSQETVSTQCRIWIT